MPSYAEENVVLKEKITALQKEKVALKWQLGGLRHQQNKTLIKKNINVVEVGSPFDISSRSREVANSKEEKREYDRKTPILQKELANKEKQREDGLEEMRKKFEEDCEKIKKQNADYERDLKALLEKEKELEVQAAKLNQEKEERQKKLSELQAQIKAKDQQIKEQTDADKKVNCSHGPILKQLNGRVDELEKLNAEMSAKNEGAKKKIEKTLIEWTTKETAMAQAEEDFKLRLQTKWQEMYQQWMDSTESRILELQQANQLLRRLVKPESGDN